MHNCENCKHDTDIDKFSFQLGMRTCFLYCAAKCSAQGEPPVSEYVAHVLSEGAYGLLTYYAVMHVRHEHAIIKVEPQTRISGLQMF